VGRTRRPNPGAEGREFVAEKRLEIAHFFRAADDARATRVARERRQSNDVFSRPPEETELVQILGRDARQNRYREDSRWLDTEFARAVVRCGNCRREHIVPAERVHGKDANSGPHERSNGGFDGARNIVELRVDERLSANRFEFGADRVAVSEQRLETDFEDHAERSEHIDEPACRIEVRYVECDNEFWSGHDGHRSPPPRKPGFARPTISVSDESPRSAR
jgi:hypothetical protein